MPIIAILVLAGGIYLYATQRSTPAELEEATLDLTGDEISLIDEEDLDTIDDETIPLAQPYPSPTTIHNIESDSQSRSHRLDDLNTNVSIESLDTHAHDIIYNMKIIIRDKYNGDIIKRGKTVKR